MRKSFVAFMGAVALLATPGSAWADTYSFHSASTNGDPGSAGGSWDAHANADAAGVFSLDATASDPNLRLGARPARSQAYADIGNQFNGLDAGQYVATVTAEVDAASATATGLGLSSAALGIGMSCSDCSVQGGTSPTISHSIPVLAPNNATGTFVATMTFTLPEPGSVLVEGTPRIDAAGGASNGLGSFQGGSASAVLRGTITSVTVEPAPPE